MYNVHICTLRRFRNVCIVYLYMNMDFEIIFLYLMNGCFIHCTYDEHRFKKFFFPFSLKKIYGKHNNNR